MDNVVQVQLYTFDCRKTLFRPQIWPIGGKNGRNCKIKKNMRGSKQKYFETATDKISSEELRKLEKIKPLGHNRASKKHATFCSRRLRRLEAGLPRTGYGTGCMYLLLDISQTTKHPPPE